MHHFQNNTLKNRFVKLVTGKTICITTAADATIFDVKRSVEDLQGIPAMAQKLYYGRTKLLDIGTIGEFCPASGAAVDLLLDVKGGGIEVYVIHGFLNELLRKCQKSYN